MTVDPDKLITGRVTLRPVTPDDEDFLRELYFSVRDDLRGLFRDDGQNRQLLLMQYAGQQMTYMQEYPNAAHYVIMLAETPVGRLIVDRGPDFFHGVDLAVLPAYRNLRIGTKVLNQLFEESISRGIPFTLSVVKTNPAVRLYERLGCRIDGETATHFTMIWESKTSN